MSGCSCSYSCRCEYLESEFEDEINRVENEWKDLVFDLRNDYLMFGPNSSFFQKKLKEFFENN